MIVLKELEHCNLRKAEVRLTEFVVWKCFVRGERVDHSVINYWERKPKIVRCLSIIISRAGQLLDKLLTGGYSFLDATKFTSWKVKTFEIHVCNRIAKETICPVGISFRTDNVKSPVKECVPSGKGELLADAGYDDGEKNHENFTNSVGKSINKEETVAKVCSGV